MVGGKGAKGQLSYSATKGAVIAATKFAAKELTDYHIRVNARDFKIPPPSVILQYRLRLSKDSIIMLMATNIAKDLQEKPLTLVCSAFGLGLTWATMILKTKPVMTLPVKHLSTYKLFEE